MLNRNLMKILTTGPGYTDDLGLGKKEGEEKEKGVFTQ